MTGYWSIIVPAATTNLFTNPSFESATTGWTAGAGHTLAQSSAQSFKGAYSGLITIGGAGTTLMSFNPGTLTPSRTYFISGWVYVPANWDGGNISLTGSSYTAAAITYNNIYTSGTSPTAQWVYLETKLVIDADVVGTIDVVRSGVANTGKTVYFDALQFEEQTTLNVATTYCDGEQPGCQWRGTQHLSASTRSIQTREGGRLVNLDSLSAYVTEVTGIGVPQTTQQVQRQALLPGDLYRGEKVNSRAFVLTFNAIGTTRVDIHSKRKTLISYIVPDTVKDAQPFKLRYTGANSTKPVEITCVYTGGMNMGRLEGFTERIALALTAYDPYFYELGEHTTIMGGNQPLASTNYILSKIDGIWAKLGTGLNGIPRTITFAPNGNVYVGGAFHTAGGVTVNHIAYWDGSTWNAIGAGPGLNDNVEDLIFDAAGNLYATGVFTDITGGPGGTYNRIVKWDGSNWSALDTGFNAYGSRMTFDLDGKLYVVGSFTTAGGTTVNRIAYWDGAAWNAMGGGTKGVDAEAYAVATMINGDIIVGGEFANAGGSAAARVARWNGTVWASMNSATLDSGAHSVNTLLSMPDGTLYAGGSFTGTGRNFIAHYNGAYWNGLNPEPNGNIYYLSRNPNGEILVSGSFTEIGTLTTADRIAIWNGSIWSLMDADLPGSPTIFTHSYNDFGALYIGFNTSGDSITSAAYTATNNGSARVYPKITIKRSGGTSAIIKWIKNETTGKTLYFDEYALQNGETLEINLAPNKREIISNVYGIARGGTSRGRVYPSSNRWSAILPSSDVADFYFLPGSNTITVYILTAGSPTLTVYATTPIKHLSVDGAAA